MDVYLLAAHTVRCRTRSALLRWLPLALACSDIQPHASCCCSHTCMPFCLFVQGTIISERGHGYPCTPGAVGMVCRRLPRGALGRARYLAA